MHPKNVQLTHKRQEEKNKAKKQIENWKINHNIDIN